MSLRFAPLAAALFLLAAACSSSSSGAGAPAGGGKAKVTGVLGGGSWASVSGAAHVGTDGKVDLLFSDHEGLCDELVAQKFHANESLVMIYNLSGKAPGDFAVSTEDVPKYATLAATCTSGAGANDNVSAAGRGQPTGATVTLSAVSASQVTGEVHVTFDDGSHIDGSFDLATCSTSEAEKATCE